ncbi:L-glyceraldehyde 3-phosphate reductase, partial [Escherichia coli]|nr:L-glyceraldehyde 3-phosphate reductase [Escherichia coli]
RWIEDGLQDVLHEQGVGSIAFCPLGRGQLTNKYVDKLKEERAKPSGSLRPEAYTDERIAKFETLQAIAARREQTISQLALNWVLRGDRVTSALIGASRVSQIEENVAALQAPELTMQCLLYT